MREEKIMQIGGDGLGRHVFTLSLSYRVQLHIFFVGKCLNPANMPYL
jgi:hypothetical protein